MESIELIKKKFRNLVGCLMYLIATKLDILYATSLLSRLMYFLSEIHLRAAKVILRYIKENISFGFQFQRS
jgi:hypothetical protein